MKQIKIAVISLIFFTEICLMYSSEDLTLSLSDELIKITVQANISIEEKIRKIEEICSKALKAKKSRVILMAADYFLAIKNRELSIKYYRNAGKTALIKTNYHVLFACGKRLAFLTDRDEGENYLYLAAVRAMKNADWFFMINIASTLRELERFDSADKWLGRAGFFAIRRKSIGGLYRISEQYRLMGEKYKTQSEYWLLSAKNLKKKLEGRD